MRENIGLIHADRLGLVALAVSVSFETNKNIKAQSRFQLEGHEVRML